MFRAKKNYNNIIALGFLITSILFNSIFNEFSLSANLNKYFNIQFLLIYFFSFNRFIFFSIIPLFFLGLVNDSITGSPLGMSSCIYILIYKIAVYQNTIKLRSIFKAEWIAFGISIFAAYILIFIIYFFMGNIYDFRVLIYNFLGTFFIYPIGWIFLKYIFLKMETVGNE